MVTISQCHEIDFQSEGEMMHPNSHIDMTLTSVKKLYFIVSLEVGRNK